METSKPQLQSISASAIETWLTGAIARASNRNPADIDKETRFSALGLESLSAVEIAGDLEVWLGCCLPDTLLWDYPSISSLAQYLHSNVLNASTPTGAEGEVK